MEKNKAYDKLIEEIAVPCKCCKSKPTLISMYGELFYAKCDCKKWKDEPYRFCGSSPRFAILEWNDYNSNKSNLK